MAKKMRIAYDKQGDVLDLSIGKPAKAISREIADDFFVRFDPVTGKVVGFSILNFEKWFKDLKDVKEIPIAGELELVKP